MDEVCKMPEGTFEKYVTASFALARMYNAPNSVILSKKEIDALFYFYPELKEHGLRASV